MENKVLITRNNGETVEGTSPVIISASRATDIPAFYSDWFGIRLASGYCGWKNPYIKESPTSYISFKNTKLFVFWTKNPQPLLPYLDLLDTMGKKYMFQYTLNDYEDERFEPNVPLLDMRISTFKKLSDRVGKDKVIWRFDPLVLTRELTPRKLIAKIFGIAKELHGYTNKLVVSFADIGSYKSVSHNMKEYGVDVVEWDEDSMIAMAKELQNMRIYLKDIYKWDLDIATCAEKIDLEEYGIFHNKCIDPEYIEKIFAEDKELVYFCRTGKLPEGDFEIPEARKNVKDKGQRALCGCMISKDIGSYSTCLHFCKYCYANHNKQGVLENSKKHRKTAESII